MPVPDIRTATAADARFIAEHVREADRRELWASSLSTPYEVMTRGISISHWSFTGLVDGVPVCMFGMVNGGITGVGVPWMVGTKLLEKHARLFLRKCRPMVQQMAQGYMMLVNHVHAENMTAINWLEWLGFTVEETTTSMGPLGANFRRFSMRGNR